MAVIHGSALIHGNECFFFLGTGNVYHGAWIRDTWLEL